MSTNQIHCACGEHLKRLRVGKPEICGKCYRLYFYDKDGLQMREPKPAIPEPKA